MAISGQLIGYIHSEKTRRRTGGKWAVVCTAKSLRVWLRAAVSGGASPYGGLKPLFRVVGDVFHFADYRLCAFGNGVAKENPDGYAAK